MWSYMKLMSNFLNRAQRQSLDGCSAISMIMSYSRQIEKGCHSYKGMPLIPICSAKDTTDLVLPTAQWKILVCYMEWYPLNRAQLVFCKIECGVCLSYEARNSHSKTDTT